MMYSTYYVLLLRIMYYVLSPREQKIKDCPIRKLCVSIDVCVTEGNARTVFSFSIVTIDSLISLRRFVNRARLKAITEYFSSPIALGWR